VFFFFITNMALTAVFTKIAALEKNNKAHREAITKNNQIFRQRMGALGAENTQLKSNLEEARKRLPRSQRSATLSKPPLPPSRSRRRLVGAAAD
jgi:hypothetical protein